MTQNREARTVKVLDLQSGPSREEALSESIIDRIKKFKNMLAEVENIPIEEAIENFQRDENPESELILWEYIALMYRCSIAKNPELTLQQKKEVYRIILGRSLGQNDFSNIVLPKELIEEIAERYQYSPYTKE